MLGQTIGELTDHRIGVAFGQMAFAHDKCKGAVRTARVAKWDVDVKSKSHVYSTSMPMRLQRVRIGKWNTLLRIRPGKDDRLLYCGALASGPQDQ